MNRFENVTIGGIDAPLLTTRDDYREADEALRRQIERALHRGDRILARILDEKWEALRAEAVAKFAQPEVEDCDDCKVYSVFGGPSHHARCGSGKAHCTCSRCF